MALVPSHVTTIRSFMVPIKFWRYFLFDKPNDIEIHILLISKGTIIIFPINYEGWCYHMRDYEQLETFLTQCQPPIHDISERANKLFGINSDECEAALVQTLWNISKS